MVTTTTALLSVSNPKVAKGSKLGYHTAILHLAPHDLAGGKSVCPWATPDCIQGCLNLAGRGGIFPKGSSTNKIQDARIRRTQWFQQDLPGFLLQLQKEISAHVRRSAKLGLAPAVRLNGTSDISWERVAPELFAENPGVQFYDYTKSARRAQRVTEIPNYHLTYSRSEKTSPRLIRKLLGLGINVAVVYQEVPLGPDRLFTKGYYQVIDGDSTDLRFLDPQGSIVGLRAKGPARKSLSGFVVQQGETLASLRIARRVA